MTSLATARRRRGPTRIPALDVASAHVSSFEAQSCLDRHPSLPVSARASQNFWPPSMERVFGKSPLPILQGFKLESLTRLPVRSLRDMGRSHEETPRFVQSVSLARSRRLLTRLPASKNTSSCRANRNRRDSFSATDLSHPE